ncbi:MAG: glycosyltransferase family 2 protein [Firmicutes bacterium]|nr:glycosyltransferase family 2 protein [Bacillota bacterium]
MLLTIGMIMKNEERFLRDCLTAIKPILDNVDSELIIHDTGSTDNSIAIAKEFTNKVFEIEWRDDFGWARQQGFERAKGEWFLVLDPDEIFENVQNIIDFFNSGEYKNYGTATVKRTEEPDIQNSPTINKPLRFFKIIEGMQWHDKIHERLLPFEEPTKNLNSTILHYGNDSAISKEKGKDEKYMRSMLAILEENPTNYKNIFLFLSYIIHTHDVETCLKYADTGINLAQKAEFDEKYPYSYPLFYPLFVHTYIYIYAQTNQYQKIIDIVEEYFEKVPKSKLAETAYCFKYQQGLSFLQQNKLVDANKALIEAYNFKKQVDNNELYGILAYTLLPNIPDIEFIQKILQTFITANLLENAIDYLQNLPMLRTTADSTVTINQYECYKSLTTAIINHNPQMLANLHSHFAEKYQPTDKQYIDIITTIELEISAQENISKINLAKNILATTTNQNSPYIKLQQLRLFLDESQVASYNINELLNYFLQQESLPLIYIDVLAVAKKYNKNFTEIAQKINLAEQIEIFGNIVQPVNLIMNMANIFM